MRVNSGLISAIPAVKILKYFQIWLVKICYPETLSSPLPTGGLSGWPQGTPMFQQFRVKHQISGDRQLTVQLLGRAVTDTAWPGLTDSKYLEYCLPPGMKGDGL